MLGSRLLWPAVLLLVGVGSAFAGTTSFNNGIPIKYAREESGNSAVYRLPASGMIVSRSMAIITPAGQNFLVDVILGKGAVWDTSNSFSASSEITLPAGFANVPTIVNNPGGTSTITYLIRPIVTPGAYQTMTLTYNGYRIKDVTNQIGAGNTIQIIVQTRNAATGEIIDAGVDAAALMTGDYGAQVDRALVAGRATIDLSTSRTNFVGGVTVDNTPNITVNGKRASILNQNGTPFQLAAADRVDFVISGNLTGITSIAWGGVTTYLSSADVANGTLTLSYPGDNPIILAGINANFTISVNGFTSLPPRTLTAAVKLRIFEHNENNRILIPAGTAFTVWDINGTLLTAAWVNGNNGIVNSRIYLWNPADVASNVSIQVYSLPNGPAGSTLLGTLSWGSLPATSGANIRVAEDILAPLGIALPYTADGGNLALVITTQAVGVFGLSQTFSSTLSYGTYPLKETSPR